MPGTLPRHTCFLLGPLALLDLLLRRLEEARIVDRGGGVGRDGDVDFAVLDINVAGRRSFPVVDILRERGIPFIFASGYGSQGLVEGYRDELTLQKPFEPQQLERAIAQALLARPFR